MADPIQTTGVVNLTAPLGSYRAMLRQKQASLLKENPEKKIRLKDIDYSREQYKEDRQKNINQRRAEGQSASTIGDFFKSGNPEIGSMISGASSAINNAFVKHDLSKNETGYEGQQKIGNMMMQTGNPVLMGIGAAWNALSTAAENNNGNLHKITDRNIKDLGLNKTQVALNNIAANVPALGWLVDDTNDTQKSHLVDEMGSSYADSLYDIDSVDGLGGSNFLFQRAKIEGKIKDANNKNADMTNIALINTQRKNSHVSDQLRRYSAYNPYANLNAKNGTKLPELTQIREMIRSRSVSEESIQKFAEGGSILPTGKLHKELNHLNELNEQFEDLTRKGIPVVTMNEGGELEQVAEIERDEICFSKEITDQLEAYWKDGSEEAMIAVGKLLTEEILYNMKDEGGVVHGDNKGKNQ